jgi:hypothetical protein
MGSSDLKEMDAGIMDPEGRGNTKGGMICGIVGCILTVFYIFVQVAVIASGGM